MNVHEVRARLTGFSICPSEEDLAVIAAIVSELQSSLPQLAALTDITDPSALSFSPGSAAGL